MKVNWKTHPNNIGHLYYPGLLPLPRRQPRQQGRQGHQQGLQLLPYAAGCRKRAATHVAQMPTQPFKHPVDIGDLTAVNCADCHSGGVGP